MASHRQRHRFPETRRPIGANRQQQRREISGGVTVFRHLLGLIVGTLVHPPLRNPDWRRTFNEIDARGSGCKVAWHVVVSTRTMIV